MFRQARIKLTVFYLLIIMSISVLFSVVVYRNLTNEIARGMRLQALKALPKESLFLEQPKRFVPRDLTFGLPIPDESTDFPANFHRQVFDEARERVALQLLLINLGILVFSGTAGYFLAGKTLLPIAQMVDEQKRFIADASHELRTPLTVIKTETEVALRDKHLNLKLAKRLLISNLEEIDKLKSLTDYFLTLSKYQNASNNFDFQVFNLAEVAKEAGDQLCGLAKAKKIKIINKLNDISIEVNKVSIKELVTILIDNAIKYSHMGSSIEVNVTTERKSAIIKVSDSGIGIKASDIPYIFNRFYRADWSRSKSKAGGYGLGLAIAKSIAELHHGKIMVKSTASKGSIFTVNLPLKQV